MAKGMMKRRDKEKKGENKEEEFQEVLFVFIFFSLVGKN